MHHKCFFFWFHKETNVSYFLFSEFFYFFAEGIRGFLDLCDIFNFVTVTFHLDSDVAGFYSRVLHSAMTNMNIFQDVAA